MNVKLKYPVSFLTNVWINGQAIANNYSVVLEMLTNSEDSFEQNVAFDRIRHIIFAQYANSILIDADDSEDVKKLRAAGLRVIELPEVPVDQIIGMSLLYKLNSVTEDRMVVTDVEISSSLSESVVYCHSVEDSAGPFIDSGWWDDVKPACSSTTSEKVVDITNESWTSYGLDWEPVDEEYDDNVVSFTKDK